MSEFTPHFAPVVALLFLGTALITAVSFLVLFYGAASLWHKKIYSVLDSIPLLKKAAQ